MATIPSNFNFPTMKQVPDHSILDNFNKQTYLGNSYSAPLPNTDTSSAQPLVIIENPASNTVSLFITEFIIRTDNAAAVSFYVNPTLLTIGTQITPINMRTGNGNTSNALCYASPTVSSNGTLLNAGASPSNYIGTSPPKIIILDPGQSFMAYTSGGSSTN